MKFSLSRNNLVQTLLSTAVGMAVGVLTSCILGDSPTLTTLLIMFVSMLIASFIVAARAERQQAAKVGRFDRED